MALANVPLDIYQGEDWTVQVIVVDQDGNSLNLTRPMQMDLRNSTGQLMLSLSVPDAGTTGVIPEIDYSADIGMIQIHIARSVTGSLPSGQYSYDLFASVDDGNAYAGSQRISVLNGMAIVSQRVTVMA